MSNGKPEQRNESDWQPDSYYSIRELDLDGQIYVMVGRGGPPSSSAVSKAKKKYSEDHEVEYRHLTAQKIGTAPRRDGGAIVAVYENPKRACHEVLP